MKLMRNEINEFALSFIEDERESIEFDVNNLIEIYGEDVINQLNESQIEYLINLFIGEEISSSREWMELDGGDTRMAFQAWISEFYHEYISDESVDYMRDVIYFGFAHENWYVQMEFESGLEDLEEMEDLVALEEEGNL